MIMSEKDNAITIYAAIGPNGDIIKSSIGSFRSQAARFASERKNYTVVKLAEINPTVRPRGRGLGVEVRPQSIETRVEVASFDPARHRRARKIAATQ
jgi:hypothetical protein